MRVRFYFDHHIHHAIVDGLRSLQVECITADEDDRRGATDEQLLDRATSLGCVLISNDADFQRIAADRWSSGRSFSRIFRLDQNKLTIGDAIENLYLIASASQAEEWIDKMEFLPV